MAHMPARFKAFHEPFLGSGALFFALKREGKIRRVVLSDANKELIQTYIAIRDSVEEVISILSSYRHTKEFYYELRGRDPQLLSSAETAARMIYLNKTGYNGLYRVNREGKFNVPFGRYRSPRFLDPENLRAVAESLKGVRILCANFETVVGRVHEGDFVYFDPPYAPLSATSNFTCYQAGGFGEEDQVRLRDVSRNLKKKGAFVMVSNSDTPLIRDLYQGRDFHIHSVMAKRAINSKGAKRGSISELIITTYRP